MKTPVYYPEVPEGTEHESEWLGLVHRNWFWRRTTFGARVGELMRLSTLEGGVMAQATSSLADVLEEVGNLPPDYVHRDREAAPGDPILLSNAIVKWNSVFLAGEPIPMEETRAAGEFVRALDRMGQLDVADGLGFVVHHKSTAHAFILIGFWHDKNELWEAGYSRAVGDPIDRFAKNAYDGRSAPFACVWELSPIWHERNAWSRFLTSERDLAAKQTWLADVYAGIA